LSALAEGVTREVFAVHPLLDGQGQPAATELLANGRGLAERQIRERLQARVDELQLGLEILPEGVCLQDLHPPRSVVSAFRDVSSAFKEKEQMKNEAEAYYRDKLIQAAGEPAWRELSALQSDLDDEAWAALWQRLQPQLSGEAAAALNQAIAAAADRTLRAEGDATSFQRKAAARDTDPHLTEYRLYLEAVEAALPGKRKLILDQRQAGRRHLLLNFPSGLPEPYAPFTESSELMPE
jgi:membrane protease subunit HflK